MVLATSASPTLPETVELRAWLDPVVERHGFGPCSTYVEACWLPLLGPTATWAYRRLGQLVLVEAGSVEVDLVDLAQSLGLGTSLTRHSKLARALGRLARYEVVRGWSSQLAVRRALPALTVAQLGRISPSARAIHIRLTGHPSGA